ncbi:MAG TPA: hypothetical protein PKM48_12535, partial [Parvularculaceae bacterium]|nr:hypothetical protein [Parvularculaceae bacterium]
GFLNVPRIKGTHNAMKSGMLAAETIFECLKAGDFSKESTSRARNSGAGLHCAKSPFRNFCTIAANRRARRMPPPTALPLSRRRAAGRRRRRGDASRGRS